jgi:hypothetical protein
MTMKEKEYHVVVKFLRLLITEELESNPELPTFAWSQLTVVGWHDFLTDVMGKPEQIVALSTIYVKLIARLYGELPMSAEEMSKILHGGYPRDTMESLSIKEFNEKIDQRDVVMPEEDITTILTTHPWYYIICLTFLLLI